MYILSVNGNAGLKNRDELENKPNSKPYRLHLSQSKFAFSFVMCSFDLTQKWHNKTSTLNTNNPSL